MFTICIAYLALLWCECAITLSGRMLQLLLVEVLLLVLGGILRFLAICICLVDNWISSLKNPTDHLTGGLTIHTDVGFKKTLTINM